MKTMKSVLTRSYLTVVAVALASPAFAVDQAAPPWPHEMSWPAFGWLFPLLCLGMMVLMMVGRGGMGCLGRGSSPNASAEMRRPGAASGSARDLLNERYVKGEIDKQEYEEKKSAIASWGI